MNKGLKDAVNRRLEGLEPHFYKISICNVSNREIEANEFVLNDARLSNPEDVVARLFRREDYIVVNIRPNKGLAAFDTLSDEKTEYVKSTIADTAGVDDAVVASVNLLQTGVPDLLVFKVEDEREPNLFFVEVKQSDGGLRRSQLEWICEHSEFDVKVAYVEKKEADI